jgi:Ca-activated chloride channel family protein
MTDELDRLTAALRVTPSPDPAAKAMALTQAMESFDRSQGYPDGLRPLSDAPRRSGGWKGVHIMLTRLSSRPILAATTSVAALCLGLAVFLPLQAPQFVAERLGNSTVADKSVERRAARPGQEKAAPATANPAAPAMPQAPAVEQLAAGSDSAFLPAPPAAAGRAVANLPASPQTLSATPPSEVAVVDATALPAPANTDSFANAAPNPVNVTAEVPVSTFSIDVDTASYAIVRSWLMGGSLPPPEAVRVEEMVNYFPYDYPAPEAGDAPFRPDITVMSTPWNPDTKLVRIALQGALPPVADRPPLNLVFLIDTSGSMQDPNKLPLLKQGFRLMLGQLRPEDQVAIVTYAGSAGEVLSPTPAADRDTILQALDRLEAGGSTAGEEGLQLAYSVAARMGGEGTVNRVLLATDGDFNVGLADPAGLEGFIAAKRKSGVYLSVLGFGRGNLDDATMQALAQAGNGTAAYIDTAQEARKVLVDQLTGALFPIADDVKIQVEWNPNAVAEWRLIGYETRALRREDFGDDRVDAGEIGAGHAVTALYEVTAPGSPALRNEPLRYAATPARPIGDDTGELGFLRLRWKAPGANQSTLLETPILPQTGVADDDSRFAAAIAGFGQLLTGAPQLGTWGWDQAIALAEGARGSDRFGYRAEAVTLMRLAQSLTQ